MPKVKMRKAILFVEEAAIQIHFANFWIYSTENSRALHQ
jgi:hypothetical protein